MEASALTYQPGISLQTRGPLLRLQSDERLVALTRRGMSPAFEVLVKRYETRLLSFCRHMLGSREDAEDVLQEVFAAAYNAMLADTRAINVRPWLYRIARNRSLNHLRRAQAVGMDSMDIHLSEHGATTADKVHEREEFRLLVGDIQTLPETQRTALVLREMDALSYEQIAEAMETTVSSVKSLLVRARVSLAEAAEARALSCEQVRLELGEVAEGLLRRPSPLVRRHLRTCARCDGFRLHLKDTNRQLAAVLPLGPLVLLRKLLITHLGHSAAGTGAAGSAAGAGAAAGSTATAAGAGSAAAAGLGGLTGSGGSLVSAGLGALAGKAAAGLAAAALVTAGAVAADHSGTHHHHAYAPSADASGGSAPAAVPSAGIFDPANASQHVVATVARVHRRTPAKHQAALLSAAAAADTGVVTVAGHKKPAASQPTGSKAPVTGSDGRTQTQTAATVLPPLAQSSEASQGSGPTGGSTSTPGSGTTSTGSTGSGTTSTGATGSGTTSTSGGTSTTTSTDPTTTSTTSTATTTTSTTTTSTTTTSNTGSGISGSPSGTDTTSSSDGTSTAPAADGTTGTS